MEYMKVEIMNL